MIFGPTPVTEAEGTILAHSLRLGSRVIKKGTRLTPSHCADLTAEGITDIIAARLETGDIGEDEAACRIGARLTGDRLTATAAFTGRVNLIANAPGLIRVDSAAVEALNGIDEALTLATLPDLARVTADQLVATVKIIPYGLAHDLVMRGEKVLATPALTHLPFQGGRARLILTRTPGFKDSLLAKGAEIVRARVTALGYDFEDPVIVPHETRAVARALAPRADLSLILGASATSDRADVAPAAVAEAGGEITRFGMPVDPGNLLFLGLLNGAPVVGLPGCARSPALNGVDWVLERLAAGLDVTGHEIAGMGVGGLLKETPERPQPRRPGA